MHGSSRAAVFRLQPVGFMRTLEQMHQEAPSPVPTGEAAFDAAYRLYTDDPAAALAVLAPDLRRDVLAFRAAVSGNFETSGVGGLASALLMGSFDIGRESSTYYVYGSPTRKIAEHLKAAAPLVLRLSGVALSR